MHTKTLDELRHPHTFGADERRGAERRTWWVIGLTAVMMTVEIAAGMIFGSMALLADGWHMGTHAAALGITVFAYVYARRHADDPRYTFGTGKVGALGGFASAVGLAVVALLVLVESAVRMAAPVAIRFDEAIAVAVIGLVVNLASALILRDHDHGHGHHGHHDHHDPHDHHDHDHHDDDRDAHLHNNHWSRLHDNHHVQRDDDVERSERPHDDDWARQRHDGSPDFHYGGDDNLQRSKHVREY